MARDQFGIDENRTRGVPADDVFPVLDRIFGDERLADIRMYLGEHFLRSNCALGIVQIGHFGKCIRLLAAQVKQVSGHHLRRPIINAWE